MIPLDINPNKIADQIFLGCISDTPKVQTLNVPRQYVPFLGYLLTDCPRYSPPYQFVFTTMSREHIGFSYNQDTIICISSALFTGSKPLGSAENEILNRTLDRLYRTTSTLPGRD